MKLYLLSNLNYELSAFNNLYISVQWYCDNVSVSVPHIHYMDKSIRTPDHYTNRVCNDIAFKYIYFNMELVPLLQL